MRRRLTGQNVSSTRKGFTIIELTIFLAILTIFCKLAVVCYGHAIECISDVSCKTGIAQLTSVINYNTAVTGDLPDVYDSLYDVNTGTLITGLPPEFYTTLPPDLILEPLNAAEIDALTAQGITAIVVTDSSLPPGQQRLVLKIDTPGILFPKWQREVRLQPKDLDGNQIFQTPPFASGESELINRCRVLCLGIPDESTLCRSNYPMFFKDIPRTTHPKGQYPFYVIELMIAEDQDGDNDEIVSPGEGILDEVMFSRVLDPWKG